MSYELVNANIQNKSSIHLLILFAYKNRIPTAEATVVQQLHIAKPLIAPPLAGFFRLLFWASKKVTNKIKEQYPRLSFFLYRLIIQIISPPQPAGCVTASELNLLLSKK